MAWFYYDENGREIGPFTGEQIKQFAQQGTITRETRLSPEISYADFLGRVY